MKTIVLRKCNHCGLEAHTEDDLDLFVKSKNSKYGHSNFCKECDKAIGKNWYKGNKERKATTCKKWYEANKERRIEAARKWQKANPEKRYEETKRKWAKENPHKINAISAKRRAVKLQATPPWFEQEKKRIEILYATAQHMGMHVDHIVPLQNKKVCGLHCLHNLQLLTPTENISKGNKYG